MKTTHNTQVDDLVIAQKEREEELRNLEEESPFDKINSELVIPKEVSELAELLHFRFFQTKDGKGWYELEDFECPLGYGEFLVLFNKLKDFFKENN